MADRTSDRIARLRAFGEPPGEWRIHRCRPMPTPEDAVAYIRHVAIEALAEPLTHRVGWWNVSPHAALPALMTLADALADVDPERFGASPWNVDGQGDVELVGLKRTTSWTSDASNEGPKAVHPQVTDVAEMDNGMVAVDLLRLLLVPENHVLVHDGEGWAVGAEEDTPIVGLTPAHEQLLDQLERET